VNSRFAKGSRDFQTALKLDDGTRYFQVELPQRSVDRSGQGSGSVQRSEFRIKQFPELAGRPLATSSTQHKAVTSPAQPRRCGNHRAFRGGKHGTEQGIG
jgi:hypothetical protein